MTIAVVGIPQVQASRATQVAVRRTGSAREPGAAEYSVALADAEPTLRTPLAHTH